MLDTRVDSISLETHFPCYSGLPTGQKGHDREGRGNTAPTSCVPHPPFTAQNPWQPSCGCCPSSLPSLLMNALAQSPLLVILELAKLSQAFSGNGCESVTISRAVKAPTIQRGSCSSSSSSHTALQYSVGGWGVPTVLERSVCVRRSC